jgi:glutathione S-transferase
VRWAFVETGDAEGWWARAQSTANMALLSVCDGVFKHHLDRTKYPERFDESAGSKAHHREQAVAVLLKPLNTQLQSTGQLGGHAPCAADIAIFPFVRQFAAVDPAWFGALPLPALQRWLGGWLTEPLFHAAMSKLPANQALAFPSPPAA